MYIPKTNKLDTAPGTLTKLSSNQRHHQSHCRITMMRMTMMIMMCLTNFQMTEEVESEKELLVYVMLEAKCDVGLDAQFANAIKMTRNK